MPIQDPHFVLWSESLDSKLKYFTWLTVLPLQYTTPFLTGVYLVKIKSVKKYRSGICKNEKVHKRHREAFVGTKSTHIVTKDDLETMAISTFSTYFKRVNTVKVGD